MYIEDTASIILWTGFEELEFVDPFYLSVHDHEGLYKIPSNHLSSKLYSLVSLSLSG